MSPEVIFKLAEEISERPDVLADTDFRKRLNLAVEAINGGFTRKVTERGIDPESAEVWFRELEETANAVPADDVARASALAVRLGALSFILSDQQTEEVRPDELLETIEV